MLKSKQCAVKSAGTELHGCEVPPFNTLPRVSEGKRTQSQIKTDEKKQQKTHNLHADATVITGLSYLSKMLWMWLSPKEWPGWSHHLWTWTHLPFGRYPTTVVPTTRRLIPVKARAIL